MTHKGPKLGWLLGGLGSLIWLPVLGVLWAVGGDWVGAVLSLLVLVLGLVYLLAFAPWRFPHTPMRWLFLGFAGVLLAGVGVAVWRYWEALSSGAGFPLVFVVTFFLPVVTLGRRTWADVTGARR